MTAILVVCTGNVCRSPVAEAMLRAALRARVGPEAPEVTSAGTAGWEGSAATRESVTAAAERGIDIGGHTARRLTPGLLAEADLVVGMAAEHREAAAALLSEAGGRIFTLKELVRLLEALPSAERPDAGSLIDRIGAADDLRRNGFEGEPRDEDVPDPYARPLDAYREIAEELEGWTERLADGLVGKAPVRSAAGRSGV